jgi:hypothetical protein
VRLSQGGALMATPAKVLAELLTMGCEGFHMGLVLHLESQVDFEMLASLVPNAARATEFYDRGGTYYDRVFHRTASGVDVTFFSPHRDTYEVRVRPSLKLVVSS